MKRFAKISSGLVFLVSLALMLSYCGGKSSDSGTNGSTGTASAGAGASASSSAIRSATLGLSATAASSSNAPSLRRTKSLSEAVNGFYSGLRAKRTEASALRAKFMTGSVPTPCAGGGTVTNSTVFSLTDITMTTSYANCTVNYSMTGMGNVQEVQNGSVVFVLTGDSFTISLGNSTTPYTDTTTRLSDHTVVQNDVAILTLSGTLDSTSQIPCGTSQSTDYSKLTFNMDGNMHSTGINNNVAYDEISVFTAYKLVVASSALDNTCTATAGTIAESGKISYTDNLDSKGTESMDISAANPLNLTWTSVTTGTTGDNYKISGTVSMVTQCFTGTLTLATTTDIFYPTNADCPTAGEVLVSGDVNGTVVYTSTGGVDIKDNTGAVVETYPSCNEAQACQ